MEKGLLVFALLVAACVTVQSEPSDEPPPETNHTAGAGAAGGDAPTQIGPDGVRVGDNVAVQEDGVTVASSDRAAVSSGSGEHKCPAGGCQVSCGKGQDCEASCAGGRCTHRGESGSSFKASCAGRGCTQECQSGGTCEFTCAGGGCTQQCQQGASCELTCAGGGCTQDCAQGAKCSTSCVGGRCN